MLTIRLQRAGKKNKPEYRVILAQKTAAASKKFIEILGNYNPVSKQFTVRNEDRLKYWIAQRVELSPTIHNLFVTKNLVDAKKVKAFSTPKKAAEEPKAEAPVAPVAEAAADVAPVEEAPVEQSPEVATEAPAEPAGEEAKIEEPAA